MSKDESGIRSEPYWTCIYPRKEKGSLLQVCTVDYSYRYIRVCIPRFCNIILLKNVNYYKFFVELENMVEEYN